ncbi:MAG: phosphonate ABC transporter, permease protein PhnE [Microbacteriaceae bacterium]|nr:phosphonate ABC transporter, permease protein PhnE [Microbacteriaceae bacterium]
MTAIAGPGPGAGTSARPRRPRTAWKVWTWVAIVAGLTALAGWAVEFTLAPSIRNVDYWFKTILAFITPNWSYFPRIVEPLWVTFSISLVAAAFTAFFAIIVAMLASRVTMRAAWFYRLTKGVLAVWRSLPDVVWAMLFVAMVGSGPFAGTLAMTFFGFGIVVKLTAETIDAVDRGPLEAVDAAGGTAFQRARVAVVPAILPNFASYALYNFESTVRASVVLGYVGAGGVGTALAVQSKEGNYENVAMIVLATLVLVIAIDALSWLLRRWLSR